MDNQKVWYITSASKGMGLALTKLVLSQGHRVAATSRKTADLIKEVGTSNSFLPLTVDLADENCVKKSIDQTVEHFGRIDVVVNNAGYALGGAIEELTDQEFRETLDINLFGTVNVIRWAMPYLRKQRSGHIFNFASVAGYRGSSGGGSYNAAKFAVVGLSEALAEEVKPFGVKVTVIAPGYFRTSFIATGMMEAKRKIEDYAPVHEKYDYLIEHMDGRQVGDPEKAVAALVQLTKEANPPVHLLLGADAFQMLLNKQAADRKEFDQWKDLTCSTNIVESLAAENN